MVILKEEKNAQLFAQWLQSETEANLQFIDGGDLDRPITAEAIAYKWDWNNQEIYLKNQKGRQLLKQRIYFAYVNQIPVGHVETTIVRNWQNDHNHWNQLYTGKTWALCCYLYVVPEQRAKGYGTNMVKQACNQAIDDGADLVSLIVAKDNYRARKFYQNVGFIETQTKIIKSGKEFLVSEYLNS
ncbi:MAG: GNAT family N-acetyltransferase [Crocosphaera sp.]|uniref:GNAT family N-acetyltransferase n=1 Tax=Crocosphaera sp. TaxID=2729996 RepID=UPI0025840281|nr:GNAT family N-acetyltransferase [Crocosphaera sp.]MCH2247708.1 GNAT family N-acetyltransferase [Crocosphaera sp.]